MGFLAGKRILLTGLLSNRSIAYGIAQACRREGAELAFTYVGERFKDRKASLEASVRYLAVSLGAKGVRVNGISAGPIKTLAASGIKGFGKILEFVEQNAPLKRNVTIEQVGNTAAFLLSDLAAGVTAEIVHVDSGFSAVVGGMAAVAE